MSMNRNWTDGEGNHDGGVSYGEGFCISWQRGPTVENGQNGAFLTEVLEACHHQLTYFQAGKFACDENDEALGHLEECIRLLKARRDRRKQAGTYGTAEGV